MGWVIESRPWLWSVTHVSMCSMEECGECVAAGVSRQRQSQVRVHG